MTRLLGLLDLLGLLGLAGLLSASAHADATAIRVQATPSWSIAIPRAFKQLRNGDSWQAAGDDRVVYVSSLVVSRDAHEPITTTVDKLSALFMKGNRTGAILQFHGDGIEGRAAVFRSDDGLDLKGFMLAEGHVATCVISYADPRHDAWAADTWRSLRLAR